MQEPAASNPRARRRRGPALAALLFCLAACDGGEQAAPGAALLESGRAKAQAGQHAAALQDFQQALAEGDSPALKIAIARSLFALERYGEAGNVLRGATATYPEDAEIALFLGTVHLKMSNLDLAARELERAAKLDPQSKVAFLYLGRALYERSILLLGTAAIDQDRLDRAIAAFQSAIALDADDVEARYRLALAYDRKHQSDGAIQELEAVVKKRPDHAEAHRMLGRLLVARGDVERGKQEILAALRVAPNDPESHYEFGVALEAADDEPTALKAYSKAVELLPVYHEAYFRQAALLRRIGREEEADRALLLFEHWETKDRELASKRLAAMAAPEDAQKQVELGTALLELMRLEEAKATFLRSIELNPNVPRARYSLGMLLWKAGDLSGARTQLELRKQLTVDDPVGLEELSRVCFLLGDVETARTTLEELIALKPDDVEARILLADILLRSKDFEGARGELEAALELEPDNARATFLLGSLSLQVGDRAEAERLWTRTLELDPAHPKAKGLLDGLHANPDEAGG